MKHRLYSYIIDRSELLFRLRPSILGEINTSLYPHPTNITNARWQGGRCRCSWYRFVTQPCGRIAGICGITTIACWAGTSPPLIHHLPAFQRSKEEDK
ncbi:hypothetical protein Y032_0242g3459 [Ancylostoma ceylanicum]|uniref:Uncharacterized protein n=1 Tax=Ancylostoma ceylanicum TaxID=53326 RepID=A0A016SDM0_9BILA|nr:hypothetical protein Y032_0242g3459 [Ancylostoma ceylanicum]